MLVSFVVCVLLMSECVGGGGRYVAKSVDFVDVVGRIEVESWN